MSSVRESRSQVSCTHVVRIGLRPEYPGGDRGQPGPLGVEFGHFHRGHIMLTSAALGM